MSSPIWTPGALASEAHAWRGFGWRLVEAQHHVSTLSLVDSLDEQELLEEIIERTKPSLPEECRHLDYLLAAPFRYGAPYPRGSRFRRAGLTPGVFYASAHEDTAVAETVFWRLLFFAESPGLPWPASASEYTAIRVEAATPLALDLTRPPLEHAAWTHPTEYEPCQQLADAAREAGIELISYRSARDPSDGTNLALLACAAFAAHAPTERRTWRIAFGDNGASAICEFPRMRLGFFPAVFASDPRIAALFGNRSR